MTYVASVPGTPKQKPTPQPDPEYSAFLAALQQGFALVLTSGEPLFTTNATLLPEWFQQGLSAKQQAVHNCRTCFHFLEQFGGLVTINAMGTLSSVLWDPNAVPRRYKKSVESLKRQVEAASVTGVFYSANSILGHPVTGPWTHMAVQLSSDRVWTSRVPTAEQAMAVKREEYGMVGRALQEYNRAVAQQALAFLESDTLYRAEKVVGPARWFATLHHDLATYGRTQQARNNIVWKAVASAPAGFAHIKTTMINTLLDDLTNGVSLEKAQRNFAEKMNPTVYQRPQAAPKAGNIRQAEQLVEQLGVRQALARRYARVEEVQAIWRPRPPVRSQSSNVRIGDGVFAHITPRNADPPRSGPVITIPGVTKLTFAKFRRDVLPNARSMTLTVPSGSQGFTAIMTATNPDAPVLYQWDNPFSQYFYTGGSRAPIWNLRVGQVVAVTAIVLRPWMWKDETAFAHMDRGATFVLEGCRDTNPERSRGGLAIFPENLKSVFHPVRATIEAYSNSTPAMGAAQASACGLYAGAHGLGGQVTVTTDDNVVQVYQIDRWD